MHGAAAEDFRKHMIKVHRSVRSRIGVTCVARYVSHASNLQVWNEDILPAGDIDKPREHRFAAEIDVTYLRRVKRNQQTVTYFELIEGPLRCAPIVINWLCCQKSFERALPTTHWQDAIPILLASTCLPPKRIRHSAASAVRRLAGGHNALSGGPRL